MNMDFPHPRKGAAHRDRRSDFAALIAVALTRQTLGRMPYISSAPLRANNEGQSSLDCRIAYFAQKTRSPAQMICGAFLPASAMAVTDHESAVNLDGSINRKSPALNRILPVDGQSMRGMEV